MRAVWLSLQIERIAATEPVRLEVPGISQLAAQIQKAVAKPVAAAAQSARRKQLSADQRRPLPGQDEQGAAVSRVQPPHPAMCLHVRSTGLSSP
jgi:hypothetical protein